jgi:hypothetical protein
MMRFMESSCADASTAIPWRATARALALRRSLLRFSALFSSCFGSLART